jgi:diaminopimelate epimerase
LPGTAVSVGNPHLVCVVADVAAVDFASAPGYDRSFFPEGVNVEVVEIDADPPRMRVYERGSGETLSCGTGACAVAAAVLGHRPGSTAVDLPGGRVTVTVTDDRCWLSGPAVLVAEGELQIDRLG